MWLNKAAGASIFHTACNKALFWEVGHIGCKNRVYLPDPPISTCHLDLVNQSPVLRTGTELDLELKKTAEN